MSYSDFVRQYLTVALMGGLPGPRRHPPRVVGRILRPDRPQEQKYLTYESGVDPVGAGWSQSQVRYYIFAAAVRHVRRRGRVHLPLGHGLERFGTFGLVEMAVFIVILALGLAYAWRKKVLRWV